jgi:hypothetical protein
MFSNDSLKKVQYATNIKNYLYFGDIINDLKSSISGGGMRD